MVRGWGWRRWSRCTSARRPAPGPARCGAPRRRRLRAKRPDGLVWDQPVHGGDGGHVVLDVVDAGELDVGGVQHYPLALRSPADRWRRPPEEHAVRQPPSGGRTTAPGPGPLRRSATRDLVVGVKDGHIPDCLVCKDVFLGSDILVHSSCGRPGGWEPGWS